MRYRCIRQMSFILFDVDNVPLLQQINATTHKVENTFTMLSGGVACLRA